MRFAPYAILIVGAFALLSYAILHRPPAPELPDRLVYEVASFDDLPGWDREAVGAEALMAMERMCIARFPRRYEDYESFSSEPFGGSEDLYGTQADWIGPCSYVAQMSDPAGETIDVSGTRYRVVNPGLEAENFASPGALLEAAFTPVRILNNSETEGMFTGYYEPELRGSRVQTDDFPTPLLSRPDDLVMVQLRDFPGEHSGRIAGRVIDGYLRPFEDRTAIEEGALDNVEPLAWVNPVDAFFLQIQGSGRVTFDDGSVMRVGYAGQNGHPYTAIGRTLIQMDELTLENVSMQSIRDWLIANPEGAVEVMRSNASYVFFEELNITDPNLGPLGAAGVPLTPGYSLAVDLTYHALGALVYVSTTLADGTPFQRLMVAQDTGGAIRGPIRGDIFFGYGDEAAALAGSQRSMGEMWVLVPNPVAERIMAQQVAE